MISAIQVRQGCCASAESISGQGLEGWEAGQGGVGAAGQDYLEPADLARELLDDGSTFSGWAALRRRGFASVSDPLAQLLGVDVDHQCQEQDQAADQDLEEAVNVDVVEAVVEHAQDEQAQDGVADTAAAAEQAGAADH